MVFGLFSRRSTDTVSGVPPPPEAAAQATTSEVAAAEPATQGSPLRQTTSLQPAATLDSVVNDDGSAILPPNTPSPAPEGADAASLYELMLTIPPKTLHAYTLAHLKPRNAPADAVPLPAAAAGVTSSTVPQLSQVPPSTSPPPSPRTASALSTFFRSLKPPPALHCVRCHKDYVDVENDDHSCFVAHDDHSALVERLPGGAYETLWECCGRTTPGDGSEGPPDGWCYEGRHTTDAKRARFRADSTIHNDKLVSCLRRNCHGIRSQLPSSSGTATVKPESRASGGARTSRKRPRASMKEASSSDAESEDAKEAVSALPDGDEPEAEESGADSDVKRSATTKKKKARASNTPHKRAKSDASVVLPASDAESKATAKPTPKSKATKPKPRTSSPGKGKGKGKTEEKGKVPDTEVADDSMAMDVDAPAPEPAVPAPEATPKPKSRVGQTKTADTLASEPDAASTTATVAAIAAAAAAVAASRAKASAAARRKSDLGAEVSKPATTPRPKKSPTKAKKDTQKEAGEEEGTVSGDKEKEVGKKASPRSGVKGRRSESKVRFSIEITKPGKEKKVADDAMNDSEEEGQRGRKKRKVLNK